MKSSVEALEGNKVKVVVDVEEAELEPALDAAWKEIAKEVRLPGFRPGKAPRKLLERQIDPSYARSEALRNALPEHYTRAVIDHDVDVVAPPELDITSGEEEGDVSFEAVVEVRPVVSVAGYRGLRVEVPSPEVDEEEVDGQIDRLRSQYGELADVSRPAAEGDYVTIDIAGTRDGEPVEGLDVEGYSYLVGSGAIAPEFDENLRGAEAGASLEFDADHPDPEEDPVHFAIEVTAVQERVLPELTDEWVADATEFETVEEFRADTRERLGQGRAESTRGSVRARVGAELAKLVEVDVPDSMVSADMQMRLQNMTQQLAASGIQLEDYMRIMGKEPEQFTAELREAAEEAVRVDLGLRAVVEAEGLAATDEEVEDEIATMIGDAGLSIEDGMDQLRDAGQLSAVRSDIANRKAMEWLVEHSEIVDPDGAAIPAELLTAPSPDDHAGHDHADHDHDHGAGGDATAEQAERSTEDTDEETAP